MITRPYFCSRITGHTARVQIAEPVRCTATTLSQSDISILAKLLSRRMPALFTRMSMRPHWSRVCLTMASTCSSLDTSAPLAIASPPAALISATTFSAASLEPPVPSRAPPKSLTTTLAPNLASDSAWDLPRPLAAPVTIATRPSKLILMLFSFGERQARFIPEQSGSAIRRRWPACRRRRFPPKWRNGSAADCRRAAPRRPA